MKARKRLGHNDLIGELVTQLKYENMLKLFQFS
jgi:hypothetical protein